MGEFYKTYLKPEDPMDWVIVISMILVAFGFGGLIIYLFINQ